MGGEDGDSDVAVLLESLTECWREGNSLNFKYAEGDLSGIISFEVGEHEYVHSYQPPELTFGSPGGTTSSLGRKLVSHAPDDIKARWNRGTSVPWDYILREESEKLQPKVLRIKDWGDRQLTVFEFDAEDIPKHNGVPEIYMNYYDQGLVDYYYVDNVWGFDIKGNDPEAHRDILKYFTDHGYQIQKWDLHSC